MPVIICDICSVAANKTMMVSVNLSYWHPRHTHYEPLVQYLPCWQQPSIKDKGYEVQVRNIISVARYILHMRDRGWY